MPTLSGIVLTAVGIGSIGVSFAWAENGTVHVHVRNDARVENDTIAEAKQIALQIYRQAELTLVWSEDDAALTIALRPRASNATAGRARDAMGYTPGGGTERGRLAFVLIDRVNAIADGYDAPKASVLGAAIAHELGHLLISKEHSRDGLMKPSFNQSDFRNARSGRLRFNDEQIRLLRERYGRTVSSKQG